MKKHAVVIAGGGPTGLVLACELRLAGVEVVVVERRETQALVGSRAGGLHARSLELLDQRGLAERFLAEGDKVQVTAFAGTPLAITDFPTRHPYALGLWQNHIERILAARALELGVTMMRACEVTGLAQDEGGVDVQLSNGATLRAGYLVGCDGGRSLVRRAAGIEFPGTDPTTSWLIAEVEMTGEPPWGMRTDRLGVHGLSRMAGASTVRVVVTEEHLHVEPEPTLADLSAALVAVYGTDLGVHEPTWLSRFTDVARQAATYRQGRVLLAGDAAHIHNPVGGQGLNTGLQDAMNLGWKLAQVVHGTSNDSLLDTYHSERHPVGERVCKGTIAQIALRKPGPGLEAATAILGELLRMDEPRKRFAGMMSGLGIHYALGEGHPLLGRRVPDLDLVVAGEPRRLFTLLHTGRPLLLVLPGAGTLDAAAWSDRVQRVDATYEGAWDLPVIGVVPPPAAVLVRPDGHVVWAGDGSDAGLSAALTRWFGTTPCSRGGVASGDA